MCLLKHAEGSSDGEADLEPVSPNSRIDEDNGGEDLAVVIASLSQLLAELRERSEKDASKDLLIARVVERLDALERDFLFREFRQPVFRDLILLADRVASLSVQFEDGTAAAIALESIEREILEVLRRQGVTPIDESYRIFNVDSQEALAVECTDDPSMDSVVLEVKRRGFSYRGTVLRPQGVVVARLKKEETKDE